MTTQHLQHQLSYLGRRSNWTSFNLASFLTVVNSSILQLRYPFLLCNAVGVSQLPLTELWNNGFNWGGNAHPIPIANSIFFHSDYRAKYQMLWISCFVSYRALLCSVLTFWHSCLLSDKIWLLRENRGLSPEECINTPYLAVRVLKANKFVYVKIQDLEKTVPRVFFSQVSLKLKYTRHTSKVILHQENCSRVGKGQLYMTSPTSILSCFLRGIWIVPILHTHWDCSLVNPNGFTAAWNFHLYTVNPWTAASFPFALMGSKIPTFDSETLL